MMMTAEYINKIMMSGECVNNQDQNAIISAFPDESKITDERSWCPMHCAVALTDGNEISEEDILSYRLPID
jgi:hypothetical protein